MDTPVPASRISSAGPTSRGHLRGPDRGIRASDRVHVPVHRVLLVVESSLPFHSVHVLDLTSKQKLPKQLQRRCGSVPLHGSPEVYRRLDDHEGCFPESDNGCNSRADCVSHHSRHRRLRHCENSPRRNDFLGVDGNDYGCHFDRRQVLQHTGAMVVSVRISHARPAGGNHHAGTFWELKTTRICYVMLGPDYRASSRAKLFRRKVDMKINSWKLKRWNVCAIALVSFAAGSLMTARFAHVNRVRADGNRVFELRIYHAVPGKMPALESRFRDTTSKLMAKHDLEVVGDWVTEGTPAWDNTFVDIVAHPSREEAKKNWDALMADPGFQEVMKSEQANKLVEKIDSIYMRPTDFSPLK
jgi:hypothetical protein